MRSDKSFRRLKKQVIENLNSKPKPIEVKEVKPAKHIDKKPYQKPSCAPGFSSFNDKKNNSSLKNRLYNKI